MPHLASITAAAITATAAAFGLLGHGTTAAALARPAATTDVAFSCPPVVGGANHFRYEPDPANTNAYYLCVGTVPQRHVTCPPDTTLQWIGPPPTCTAPPANS